MNRETQIAHIKSAFTKLGAERLRAGMEAFKETEWSGFHGCFTARCYGPPGQLQKDVDPDVGFHGALGITEDELKAMYMAFDHDAGALRVDANGEAQFAVSKDEFKTMVEEHLATT